MFKFLLVGINSKYIHTNPAIQSLKAYAGSKYSENIELAEYTINNQRSEILADIYKRKPDAIGFSVYIWNVSMVQPLLSELAQILPDVPVFLGGPEVSYDAIDYLNQYPNITGVIVGEGEETFKELLSFYIDKDMDKTAAMDANESGSSESIYSAVGYSEEKHLEDNVYSLHNIKGLQLRDERLQERAAIGIDALPFFYDKTLIDSYVNKIIYYESSRGCPFRCSYCLSSIEKNIRLRDLEMVKEELQFFLDAKVPQVKFIDRTFNCNPSRAVEIWKYILENDNGITNFHFEVAADIMKDEEIDILQKMRPGLVQLEIGVQTTNEKTLNAINRKTDIEKIKTVVERLKKNNNVHLHLDLIAGLPYEDYESFKTSFNDVFNMKGHQLQLGFLKVLKGAPISTQVEEHGIKYTATPPYEVLETKYITFEEIMRLKNVERVLDTFYNSAQFTMTLPYIMKYFETPYNFFDELAQYYDEKGYFVMTPKRSRKYDILLEFAEYKVPSIFEELRELLTLDYYLREKPKSKPDFVVNVPPLGVIDYEQTDPITGNHIMK